MLLERSRLKIYWCLIDGYSDQEVIGQWLDSGIDVHEFNLTIWDHKVYTN